MNRRGPVQQITLIMYVRESRGCKPVTNPHAVTAKQNIVVPLWVMSLTILRKHLLRLFNKVVYKSA